MNKGSIGQLEKKVAIVLGQVQNPPLRGLYAKASGNVAFILEKDDPTDSAAPVVRTLSAGTLMDQYSILAVISSGTTIDVSNLEGFI